MIVTYTIVGSLFVPFLAATLLYLNNRNRDVRQSAPNGVAVNAVLASALALYFYLAVRVLI